LSRKKSPGGLEKVSQTRLYLPAFVFHARVEPVNLILLSSLHAEETGLNISRVYSAQKSNPSTFYVTGRSIATRESTGAHRLLCSFALTLWEREPSDSPPNGDPGVSSWELFAAVKSLI